MKCEVDGNVVRIPVVDAVGLVVCLLRAASPNGQLPSNGKRTIHKMSATLKFFLSNLLEWGHWTFLSVPVLRVQN